MNQYEQQLLIVKGLISTLPPEQQKACNDLVAQIRQSMKAAGEPVATIAIALIGAEIQASAS